MTVSIEELAKKVPKCCHAKQCKNGKCKVRLTDAPSNRLIINMDCKALGIDNETRCDFLFVGKENSVTWVVPIELKSGRVDGVTHVVNQLKSGAKLAEKLLSSGTSLQFVPVLAYNKLHKDDRRLLRVEKIRLRGVDHKIKAIKCGEHLPVGSNSDLA